MDATIGFLILGSVSAAGVLVGIWFQLQRKPEEKPSDRSVTAQGNIEGPVATGEQSTVAGQHSIAVGSGHQGDVNIIQQGTDKETLDRIARLERKLEEFQDIARPPEGAAPVEIKALAAQATERTEQSLDQALELQKQNREKEAIDALYVAFRGDLEPRAKVEFHILLGNSFSALSRLKEAEGHYTEALDAARAGNFRESEAAALGNLGIVHADRGDLARANEYHQEALAIDRATGNRLGEAQTLSNLGTVYRRLGDDIRAEEHYERVLATLQQIGHRGGEAAALGNLGLIYTDRADLQRADEHHQRSLSIHREIGNRLGEATQLGNLGNVYAGRGNSERAQDHYQQALTIAREIGHRLGEANQLANLGTLYFGQGDLERAEGHYQQALPIHRQIRNRLGEATDLANLGLVTAARNQRDAACRLLKEAAAIYDETGAGGPGPDKVRAKLEELGCE